MNNMAISTLTHKHTITKKLLRQVKKFSNFVKVSQPVEAGPQINCFRLVKISLKVSLALFNFLMKCIELFEIWDVHVNILNYSHKTQFCTINNYIFFRKEPYGDLFPILHAFLLSFHSLSEYSIKIRQ